MIENHIKIVDLLIKEPRLIEDWSPTDDTLNNHINDAFNKVCNELAKYQIDTRHVMIPLRLYEGKIYNNQIGNWVKAQSRNRVKRIVIKINGQAPSVLKIYLDGTQDDRVANNQWVDNLVTLHVNSNFATATFPIEYKFYRFKIEFEAELEPNLNLFANIYLVETAFDDLIIFKTLENFFFFFFRTESDGFLSKMQMYKNKFIAELENLTCFSDEDEKPQIILRVAL
jgi:hypothetical protein